MPSRALTELLRGQGAHAIHSLHRRSSADLATRQVAGFPHSIAQLVFHMNYWMDYDLRRVRNEKPPYPPIIPRVFRQGRTGECRMEEWQERFATLLNHAAEFADSNRAELDRQVEATHPVTSSGQVHSKRFCGSSSPQQLSHRTNRNDPAHVGRMAAARRRGYLVEDRPGKL